MPCHTRMKIICLQGLLWFYFLEFGFMVMSLEPGFLDFDNLPDTNFSCVGKVIGGYYADLETNCQMFHVCTIGQSDEPMDIRFLCLNGTVFDQETRVCERIDEVDCTKSEKFYSLNLELYGNTQPPLLEETPETETVFTLKKTPDASTTTSTSTTTQTSVPKSQPSSQIYYNSFSQTTSHPTTKEITSVHLPVGESSDIRFNPLEVNVNLKPQSPPIIKTQIPKPISFHHQSFVNDNPRTKVTLTTPPPSNYKSNKPHRVPLLPSVNHHHETSEKPEVMHPLLNTGPTAQDIFDFISRHHNAQMSSPSELSFGFMFHNNEDIHHTTERNKVNYDFPRNHHVDGLRPPPLSSDEQSFMINPKNTNNLRNEYSQKPTARVREKVRTTKRLTPNVQVFSTDKPHGIQLPLPALPQLHPLSFSSPAPFSLNPRAESKRYTSNNNAPRIVISARASVSDNSGRRLNYSLGTIGETELVGIQLPSYDDYKEDTESLSYYDEEDKNDKKKRSKRNVEKEIDELFKSENGGADVLKYLYDWYSKQEESTTPPSLIAEINYKLAPMEPEIAESRGEYSLKTTVHPPTKQINNKRRPPAKSNKKIIKSNKENNAPKNYPKENGFRKDRSEEEFEGGFGTPFGGFESKHFDFMLDNDHSFFGKDDQDSFEDFKDIDDFPAHDLADVTDDINKDDKKGRKYSYKKIVLSQASKDNDPEIPNGQSIVKNNKVISHETFSEFTNFTDYDENEDGKAKPNVLTTEKIPQNVESISLNTPTENTSAMSGSILSTSQSTNNVLPQTTPSAIKTTTSNVVWGRTTSRNNNSRRRSRYRSTTYSTVETTTVKRFSERMRNSRRFTKSRTTTTTTTPKPTTTTPEPSTTTTNTIPTTTNGSTQDYYENIDDYDDEYDSFTLSSPDSLSDVKTTTESANISQSNAMDDYSTKNDQTTMVISKETSNFEDDETYTTEPSLYLNQVTRPVSTTSSSLLEINEHEENSEELPTEYQDELRSQITEENLRSTETFKADENSTMTPILLETTTLRTSLPLEEIFSYFVSTTKPSTSTDNQNYESTTTDDEYSIEPIESLIRQIEDKTKSVVNEKDMESLNEMNATDHLLAITSKIPTTITLPSTKKHHQNTSLYNKKDSKIPINNNMRHRFSLNKGNSKERNTTNVYNDLINSVRQALETSTSEFNYLTTQSSDSNDGDVYDLVDYVDDNFHVTNEPRVTSTDHAWLSETSTPINTWIKKTPDTLNITTKESFDTTTSQNYVPTSTDPITIYTTTSAFQENEFTNERFKTTESLIKEEPNNYSTTPDSNLTATEKPILTTTIAYRRKSSSHRFGFNTRKSSYRTRQPTEKSPSRYSRRRKPNYQKTKVDIVASYSENNTTERSRMNRNKNNKNVKSLTEQPLAKNVSPTQVKTGAVHATTPYSNSKSINVGKISDKLLAFSCFEKEINKFYSDPRDCRLFHYCTPGYSKSQIVDMKFVCDLGTYFDDKKLVCSKSKPTRCL